ncbi:Negative regulator of GroEL [Candidatus Methanophagaceae archaeon]|nr:Negative regulator of GroEL [Methanophagales archaeon]
MKPMSLSPPQIALPTYSGGKAVVVFGYLAGQGEITIFRYPALGGGPKKIGHGKVPMVDVFNIEVNQLMYNDRVFAMQTVTTKTLKLTSPHPIKIPTTQLPPSWLNPPVIRTPLYACARKIKVGSIINGALVEVFVNKGSIFKGPIGIANLAIGCKPLRPGDDVYAIQSFPDVKPSSFCVERVVKYPARQLPKPTILKPLIECAPSFEVSGLEPGAIVYIYEGKSEEPIAREVVAEPVSSIEIPGGLKKGWVLSADQELCGKTDRSSRSDMEPVEEIGCFSAYPPNLHPPVKPGVEFIVVEGVHESTIRIVADGKDIGGGTCFGITAFALDSPLPKAEIQLIQSLDCRGTVWEAKSKPVKSVPDDKVRELDESNFYATITTATLPVMVEFFMTGCGPCAAIAPKMQKLAKDYAGRAIIACVNYTKYKPYSISAVPSFMFFKNGKVVPDKAGNKVKPGFGTKLTFGGA